MQFRRVGKSPPYLRLAKINANVNPYLPLALLCLFFVTACGDDDEQLVIDNEVERVTEFVYTLTPVSGGPEVKLVFQDNDGPGGSDPLIQVTNSLVTNTTYAGSILLSDRSQGSVTIDVTAQVREEADDHQFFFLTDTGLELSFTYDDMDVNGRPLGLLTELVTGGFGSGDLTVELRQRPDKAAAGVSIGNPDPAGGELVIEVEFPVSIGG